MARVHLAFNGPNGDEDPAEKGYIAWDGEHTSGVGQELIAELLWELGYEPLGVPVETTIIGEYIDVGNPCTTEPCIPGVVYAVFSSGQYYYLTQNGSFIWVGATEEPPSWKGYTPEVGDWVSVTGTLSEKTDINGKKFYALEVISLVPR